MIASSFFLAMKIDEKQKKKTKKKKLPERTKFSSLSAPTKIEELTAESDERTGYDYWKVGPTSFS